jgi:hypothetical protein
VIVGSIICATICGILFAIGLLIAGYPVWLVVMAYIAGGIVCTFFLVLWILWREKSEAVGTKNSCENWQLRSSTAEFSIDDSKLT